MRIFYVLLFSVLFISNNAYSQSPKTMSFQGVLTDNNGESISDGSYSLNFTLYDDASGGTLLWEEDITTEVSDGIFSVILGRSESLDLPFDQPYWLGIAVDGGVELSPRTVLTAAPYSLGGKATELDIKNTAEFSQGIILAGQDTSVYLVPLEEGLYFGPDSTANNARGEFSTRSNRVKDVQAGETDFYVRSLNAASPDLAIFALGGSGILTDATSGYGIQAISQKSIAVVGLGLSTVEPAIKGINKTLAGVLGDSDNGRGVIGISKNSIGVKGEGPIYGVEAIGTGDVGTGLHATGSFYGIVSSGEVGAARFNGDVRIEESGQLKIDQVQSDQSDKILVWADNKFVKFRSLNEALEDIQAGGGFTGCLNNLDFKVQTDGKDFLTVSQDKIVDLKGSFSAAPEGGETAVLGIGTGSGLSAAVVGISDADEQPAGSDQGTGVLGTSIFGNGVVGIGNVGGRFLGETAGLFEGDVLIEDMGQLKIDRVDADLSDNLLVWADDKFVKTRSLTDAVQDLLPDDADMDPINEIQTISKDGTVISLDKNGQSVTLLDDDPTNELFDGTLNDQTLLVNVGGESTFQVNNDRCTFVDGALGVNGILDKPAITSVAENNVGVFSFNNSPTLPTVSITNTATGGPVLSAQGNAFFGNGVNTFITLTPGATQVAEFFGDLQVNGMVNAQGKSFIIDHPLEPETKQLRHFSIESDQLTNIYNGNAVMDENGEAWVELPEWFEALNEEFTYQLTCVGGYANVYIAEEVKNNKFKIGGGNPGLKVSWQVSGIRHDKQSQEIDQTVEFLKQ